MELNRHDYDSLLRWKNRKKHLPIILRGLRQIGKSHLAERFAFDQYGEGYCPILDFRHDGRLESLFKDEKGQKRIDVNHIIEGIRILFPDKKIEKGKTCIVMDEVGDCPFARESFKVFGSDSGYDIIATGSLLGLSQIQGEGSDTPIGYEEYLDMTPLNFIEFLENSNVSKEAIDKIFLAVKNNDNLPPAYHEVLFSHLHRYLLVGGMPEAVAHF
ncbi:MAG: AAA family ATPase, partial [Bacilli bacterium]|nr:AAA family ATPase [Bacilli bacterium]